MQTTAGCISKRLKPGFSFLPGLSCLFCILYAGLSYSQDTKPASAVDSLPSIKAKTHTKHPFTITTPGFGGIALKLSQFNNQLAIMSGGRGAATINHHYTIGGSGCGIVNDIELESNSPDTFKFVKMGYGGLELGYFLFPDDKKANIGVSLLIAAGAAFKKTYPKTEDSSFKIFPVLEPALYGEVALSRLIRLHLGATYRYLSGSNLPYISDRNMRGFSGYVNLLLGTCTCD
jgi:hypothetical protein